LLAVGKRIIRASYPILRTGKPYDGSQDHFHAHQTTMLTQLKRGTARVHDLADEIHAIAGIEGGFTLCARTDDASVNQLGLTTRTCRVLQKAGITTLSMLWFRLIQGTLMDVEHVGKTSYEEVISVLVISGRILKR